MSEEHPGAARRAAMPTELNPFLVQVVATGIGGDLPAARAAAHASLRKRATQIRTQFKFPTIFGMSYALTGHVEQFSSPDVKKNTTATLAAWYHLDFERQVMTPLPHHLIGQVKTGIIEEYDVVFCEGY